MFHKMISLNEIIARRLYVHAFIGGGRGRGRARAAAAPAAPTAAPVAGGEQQQRGSPPGEAATAEPAMGPRYQEYSGNPWHARQLLGGGGRQVAAKGREEQLLKELQERQLAKRPEFGKEGRPLNVFANYYPINFKNGPPMVSMVCGNKNECVGVFLFSGTKSRDSEKVYFNKIC